LRFTIIIDTEQWYSAFIHAEDHRNGVGTSEIATSGLHRQPYNGEADNTCARISVSPLNTPPDGWVSQNTHPNQGLVRGFKSSLAHHARKEGVNERDNDR